MTLQFPGTQCSKVSLIVLRNRVEISAQKSHRFDVAPVLDFPGGLGRVKASFADAHRLRGLDPPGTLPSCCNYRSDGEINNGDSL